MEHSQSQPPAPDETDARAPKDDGANSLKDDILGNIDPDVEKAIERGIAKSLLKHRSPAVCADIVPTIEAIAEFRARSSCNFDGSDSRATRQISQCLIRATALVLFALPDMCSVMLALMHGANLWRECARGEIVRAH